MVHDGAAAGANVRQLSHEALQVHPVGGARSYSRDCNFEWVLRGLGVQCSSVVVVWAGNDLKWWRTAEEL